MNIRDIFHQTVDDLINFTRELEKAKSYAALREVAPLWRVIKSIQVKYVKGLDEKVEQRLDALLERLDVRDVAATSFSEEDAARILVRVGISVTIDPDLVEQAENELYKQHQESPSNEPV